MRNAHSQSCIDNREDEDSDNFKIEEKDCKVDCGDNCDYDNEGCNFAETGWF